MMEEVNEVIASLEVNASLEVKDDSFINNKTNVDNFDNFVNFDKFDKFKINSK